MWLFYLFFLLNPADAFSACAPTPMCPKFFDLISFFVFVFTFPKLRLKPDRVIISDVSELRYSCLHLKALRLEDKFVEMNAFPLERPAGRLIKCRRSLLISESGLRITLFHTNPDFPGGSYRQIQTHNTFSVLWPKRFVFMLEYSAYSLWIVYCIFVKLYLVKEGMIDSREPFGAPGFRTTHTAIGSCEVL